MFDPIITMLSYVAQPIIWPGIALLIILAAVVAKLDGWFLGVICVLAVLFSIFGGYIWWSGEGDDSPFESIRYYGYFAEMLPNGETDSLPNREELNLRFGKVRRVFGSSTSKEPRNGVTIDKKYTYVGVRRNGRLVLNYVTEPSSDEKDPAGIGAIVVLQEKNSENYTGGIIEWDCEQGKFIQCPYAMSKNNMEPATAKNQWSVLFATKCADFPLPPLANLKLAANTACTLKVPAAATQ